MDLVVIKLGSLRYFTIPDLDLLSSVSKMVCYWLQNTKQVLRLEKTKSIPSITGLTHQPHSRQHAVYHRNGMWNMQKGLPLSPVHACDLSKPVCLQRRTLLRTSTFYWMLGWPLLFFDFSQQVFIFLTESASFILLEISSLSSFPDTLLSPPYTSNVLKLPSTTLLSCIRLFISGSSLRGFFVLVNLFGTMIEQLLLCTRF